MKEIIESEFNTYKGPSKAHWLKKFKEILVHNGITSPVSDVIVESAGLRGENLTSQAHYVTVKFEDCSSKPLNLFMKTTNRNPKDIEVVEDMRLFEKEAIFFMKYIPAIAEYCRNLGYAIFKYKTDTCT